jgi:hypothetical protein
VGYKSSVNEIDHFIGSHVFEDMTATFEDWMAGVREKLEDEKDIDEVRRCQGRIQVLRDVLLWAENFRGALEENLKEASNGR